MKTLISVINWNNSQATNTCLGGLAELGGFDLLVIDNGSEQELIIEPEIMKKLGGRLEVVRSRDNTGFSGGHNQAAEKAAKEDYDYLLLLNNDTEIIDNDFINKLVDELESNNNAALVAPTIYFSTDPDEVWYAGGRYSKALASVQHNFIPATKTVETSFATGCCLLVRVKMLSKIGGLFDDRYFLYWEDADLSARVLKAGMKILYAPKAKILHRVSSSLGVRSKTYAYYNIRNKFRFYRRNTPIYMRPLALTNTVWLTCKYLGIAVLRGPINSVPVILKAFLHGLIGRYGKA